MVSMPSRYHQELCTPLIGETDQLSDDPESVQQVCYGKSNASLVVLSDVHIKTVEALVHFVRERILERFSKTSKLVSKITLTLYRSVHAKATAAFGLFERLDDVSNSTKAKFLSGIGRKARLLTRISVVSGEKGFSDTFFEASEAGRRNFTLNMASKILYSAISLSSLLAVPSSSRL